VYWVKIRGSNGQLSGSGEVVLVPGVMIGEDDLRKFREIEVMILQVLCSPLSPAEVGSQL
jgi:hypothetical protein